MERKPGGVLPNRRAGPRAELASQVLPGEFTLRDGTPAMIWPLLPTDAETLREGFRRLSAGFAPVTGSSECSINSMTR